MNNVKMSEILQLLWLVIEVQDFCINPKSFGDSLGLPGATFYRQHPTITMKIKQGVVAETCSDLCNSAINCCASGGI